jgi:hypothetical protein
MDFNGDGYVDACVEISRNRGYPYVILNKSLARVDGGRGALSPSFTPGTVLGAENKSAKKYYAFVYDKWEECDWQLLHRGPENARTLPELPFVLTDKWRRVGDEYHRDHPILIEKDEKRGRIKKTVRLESGDELSVTTCSGDKYVLFEFPQGMSKIFLDEKENPRAYVFQLGKYTYISHKGRGIYDCYVHRDKTDDYHIVCDNKYVRVVGDRSDLLDLDAIDGRMVIGEDKRVYQYRSGKWVLGK